MSYTSNPLRSSMKATMFFPMSCMSPFTVPRTTFPTFLPAASPVIFGFTISETACSISRRIDEVGDKIGSLLESLAHDPHGLFRLVENPKRIFSPASRRLLTISSASFSFNSDSANGPVRCHNHALLLRTSVRYMVVAMVVISRCSRLYRPSPRPVRPNLPRRSPRTPAEPEA